MLARANRVVRAEDFRRTVRRGRRSASPLAIYYRVATDTAAPARFGFIVSRSVGGAVERNLLRRRMRAVGRELVDAGARGHDVVIRALPGCAERGFAELRDEMYARLDLDLLGHDGLGHDGLDRDQVDRDLGVREPSGGAP